MKNQGQQKAEIHPYNAAGRKLLAALISHQLRLTGVDYTLKDMPKVVDPCWAELAEKLIREMIEADERRIFGSQNSGPHSGPQKTERKM